MAKLEIVLNEMPYKSAGIYHSRSNDGGCG